jgi:hypothetical protein
MKSHEQASSHQKLVLLGHDLLFCSIQTLFFTLFNRNPADTRQKFSPVIFRCTMNPSRLALLCLRCLMLEILSARLLVASMPERMPYFRPNSAVFSYSRRLESRWAFPLNLSPAFPPENTTGHMPCLGHSSHRRLSKAQTLVPVLVT